MLIVPVPPVVVVDVPLAPDIGVDGVELFATDQVMVLPDKVLLNWYAMLNNPVLLIDGVPVIVTVGYVYVDSD